MTLDDVFGLLANAGKDASMSSRVPLWQILMAFIDAHNGYIETWLDLGAVGLIMMSCFFVRFAVRAAIGLYRSHRDPWLLLCFVYVPVCVIQNITEATILQRNSMSWSLIVLLYIYLAREGIQRPIRVPAVFKTRSLTIRLSNS